METSCSFCGKKQDAVEALIAGPNVYICNECISLCQEIINERNEKIDPLELKKAKLREDIERKKIEFRTAEREILRLQNELTRLSEGIQVFWFGVDRNFVPYDKESHLPRADTFVFWHQGSGIIALAIFASYEWSEDSSTGEASCRVEYCRHFPDSGEDIASKSGIILSHKVVDADNGNCGYKHFLSSEHDEFHSAICRALKIS